MPQINFLRKTLVRLLLFTTGVIVLYSCDVLESDVAPQTPEIKLTGKEIYVVQNGTGYIDLYSIVKSTGDVRLDISSQPRNGNLTEFSKGLLQYSANPNFKKGRDSFEFSIYSTSNNLLKRDSIVIIVEDDSTNLPCGIYPQNDFVDNHGGVININVLANDLLCGDSTTVGVEIYRPESYFPPYTGTAIVQNNIIQYTPGNSFTGADKIVYKVFSLQDSSKFGIGIVYIGPLSSGCQFEVYVDNFVFGMDSINSDTLHLNVFNNDELCGRAATQYQFTILENGDVGTAVFHNEFNQMDFAYIVPDTITRNFSDSLLYKMCNQQRCRTAKVYINVNF